FEESLALEKRTLAIREKALGPDHPEVAWSLIGEAESDIGLGRFAAAIPLVERSFAILAKHEVEPGTVAQARFALARGLWGAGRDRRRALELARQAGQTYAADPAHVRDTVE